MYLERYSPHLRYFIERKFSEVPACLEECFKFSIDKGGSLELDYKREEGQSYNPRPARIALIGMKDGGIEDLESIQLLILSSLMEKGEFSEQINSKEIIATFPNINNGRILKLEEMCTAYILGQEDLCHSDTHIYLCQFIDRMRHSHLSKPKKIKEMFDRLDTTLIKSPSTSSTLILTIESWKEKMSRQFPELKQ